MAIDKFKREVKEEIVGALKPHFKIINRRLEIIEKHMGRHCKEIQKVESTIKSHNRILRSHDFTLKKLIKEE